MAPLEPPWRGRVNVLIRLLTFQPGAAAEVTDHFLRATLLPGLIERAGLLHAHVGRMGAELGTRVVVSVWEADDGAAARELARPFAFETDGPVIDPRVELYPASVALTFAPPEGAQILRIFRGRTRAGETANYLDAVREGTLADVATGHGPLALFLALVDSEHFVTVSVWSSWQRIEAATGGNIRQPIATRHSGLLLEGGADHFEIVPNTLVVPAEPPGTPAQLAAPGIAQSG